MIILYSTNIVANIPLKLEKKENKIRNRHQTNKHRTTIDLNLTEKPNQTLYLPIIRSMYQAE